MVAMENSKAVCSPQPLTLSRPASSPADLSMYKKIKHIPLLIILACLLTHHAAVGLAADSSLSLKTDDTMLMFVGEQLELLSIASKREQSAVQAPAVADVVTRREFFSQGLSTLAQVLERQPGFHMAQREFGSLPYLRGMPNSALFLYDTVPLISDTSKSLHQLDRELSLSSVKQIEIIRGPASVLWGPDAFAGVVNVVPLSGADIDGLETGLRYRSPDEGRGFFVNAGRDFGLWEGMLSINYFQENVDDPEVNLVRFFGPDDQPVPPEERFGSQSPGDRNVLELLGQFEVGDWLNVSGRLLQSDKPYAVSQEGTPVTWREGNDLSSGFVKTEASFDLDPSSALRFTGYYSFLDPDFSVINESWAQRERTLYGELIYDRSLWTGQGLFTGGVSYRSKEISNAPIWDKYLPSFLSPENELFLPQPMLEDYSTRLWSLFGQYTHKFKEVDFVFGARGDFHDSYADQVSFSSGLVWNPNSHWNLKLLYGNAYRTPFAKQLLEENTPFAKAVTDQDKPDLEQVQTVNLLVSWSPVQSLKTSVTGFYSLLDSHIVQIDPYAGLSEQNDQEIYGLEVESTWSPLSSLNLTANLTLQENSGPDEEYFLKKFSIVRPDGTVEDVFEQLSFPYDSGPDILFNCIGTWTPLDRVAASLRLGYVGEPQLILPRESLVQDAPGYWVTDVSLRFEDLGADNLDLSLAARNVFDRGFDTPGTMSMLDGFGREIEVSLSYRW